MTVRALIIDPDPQRARIARRALSTSCDDVVVATEDEAGYAELWDLVLVAYEIVRATPTILSRLPRSRLVLTLSNVSAAEIGELFSTHRLTNLLGYLDQPDAAELLTTAQKVVRRDIFGVEKYFGWRSAFLHFELARASARFALFEELRTRALSWGVSPRLVEQLEIAADELVTNALFNSPVDEHGSHLYSGLHRKEEVVLPSDRPVRVVLAGDEHALGISVRDSYGSLKPNTVIDYLSRCLREPPTVEEKDGGAGLGLFTSFTALTQLIVNVAEGRSTEMIGIIDTSVPFKTYAARTRSFNLFVEPDA